MTTLSRRQLLGTVPAAAVTVSRATGAAAAPVNVLLVVVDALPASVLGPHPRDPGGRMAACMPGLRALSTDGFVFRAALAAHPEPGPAAAAIWTGRPGSETDAMRTGQPVRRDLPIGLDWIAEHTTTDVFYAGQLGIPGRAPSSRCTRLLSPLAPSAHDNLAVTRVAAAAVANQPPGRPWLGVVGLRGLSALEAAAEAWRGQERAPDLGLPERELPPAPDRTVPDGEPPRIHAVVRRPAPGAGWPDALWRHVAWTAEGQLRHLDRCITELVSTLDGTVHAGNTLVIVTAACGHPGGRHGLLAPGAPYSHSLEVPCVVRGLATGGTDALVSGLDLLPTLCDVLGAPQLPSARGFSMRPLLEQTAGTWRPSVVSEAHIDARVVRTAEFAYVAYPGGHYMLFHTRNDPHEHRNLALDTGYSSTVSDHQERLAQHALTLEPTAAAEAGWLEE